MRLQETTIFLSTFVTRLDGLCEALECLQFCEDVLVRINSGDDRPCISKEAALSQLRDAARAVLIAGHTIAGYTIP